MATQVFKSGGRRERSATHDGFLRYKNFRWAKIAGLMCLIAIAAYLMVDVQPIRQRDLVVA